MLTSEINKVILLKIRYNYFTEKIIIAKNSHNKNSSIKFKEVLTDYTELTIYHKILNLDCQTFM